MEREEKEKGRWQRPPDLDSNREERSALFDDRHYVPILKGKMAEYDALATLGDLTKQRLTPVIEVIPPEKKGLEDHLLATIAKIQKAWGVDRRFFLDVPWILDTETVPDRRTAVAFLLDGARARGLQAIPVTTLNRGPAYNASVKDALAVDKCGMCLRLIGKDFGRKDLQLQIDRLLKTLGTTVDATDLLIDFRSISEGQASALAAGAETLLNQVPNLAGWRTLTLAATAFPPNLSGVATGTMVTIERTEWLLWTTLRQRGPTLKRIPTFGDYAVEYPDLAVIVDPRVLRVSSQLRYAADQNWVVLKGTSIRSSSKRTPVRFPDLCRVLVKRAEYRGRSFSWGDRYIHDCAKDKDGPGNPTKWRQVGTNHHLTFITDQIASLP